MHMHTIPMNTHLAFLRSFFSPSKYLEIVVENDGGTFLE